jgi:ABC-type nitrate/sulfonate/bicarbonate transport system substrate-binding protein
MRRALASLTAVIAVAAALTACGGSAHTHTHTGTCCDAAHATRPRDASLVLDYTPNAIHVGIYTALARHFDTEAGIKLHVIVPGASTDAISELETGKVDFAILDIHDLAIAREKGQDIRGILPIVEEPLAAVITSSAVTDPRQLAGQTVGVSGDPSDLAVLHSIVAGSGGNPSKVSTLDIGYNNVADLLSGRIHAATGFWNDEGVTLRRRKPGGFHIYRVQDYGAPSYPELVVAASAHLLTSDPSLAHGLVTTLTHGYDYAIAHPAAGAKDLESEVQGLDPSLVSAELPGEVKAFTGPEDRFGALDEGLLRRWARWEKRFGIVKTTPDVSAMFDTAFADKGP